MHPATYEALGRPGFFTPLAQISFVRFLVLREHRHLEDRALGLASDAALVVLVLYLVGFVFLARNI
jgi:hypothetical protein